MGKEMKSRKDSPHRHRRRSPSTSRKRSRGDKSKRSRRSDSNERSLSRSPSRERRDGHRRSRHKRSRSRDRDRRNRSRSHERSSSRSASRRRRRDREDRRRKSRKDDSRERSSSRRRSDTKRSKKEEARSSSRDRWDKTTKRRKSGEASPSPTRKRSRKDENDEVKKSEINNEEVEKQKKRERLEKWKEQQRTASDSLVSCTNSDEADSNSSDGMDEAGKANDAEADKTIDSEMDEEVINQNSFDEKLATDNLNHADLSEEEDTLDAFNKQIEILSNIESNGKAMSSKTSNTKASSRKNKDDFNLMPESSVETLAADIEKLKNAGTKKLTVDHSKISYMEFRKNFYIEVPEITNMKDDEVADYMQSLDITVKGKNCPRPVKTWAQCGVRTEVLGSLKKHKFEKLTPIQAQAIPVVMSGRDMIGIAKTGSGKTLAFLIPMFRHILDQPELNEGDGPIALIMTPTRELADQICKECVKFTKALGLRTLCVYGGNTISNQIGKLKRGAEIVVCTPGRMIDILTMNNQHVTNLRRVTYVVLDEADRMLDAGFELQVKMIMNGVRPDRMVVMFSATFPLKIQQLATSLLKKPIMVTVGEKSVVCNDVEQHIMVMEEKDKFSNLLALLNEYRSRGAILVFVKTKKFADELASSLLKLNFPCSAIHGGIDQEDRTFFMNQFKSGDKKLLISTSVCARGVDVKDVILVVNYDCHDHYEDYVHRCGRTGRAGNKGFAYTFITQDEANCAGDLIKGLESSQADVPQGLRDLWENYETKMKSEGKKIFQTNGFRGKGFTFDKDEKSAIDEKKTLEKVMMGECDIDDDDLNKHVEKMFSSKKVSENKKPSNNTSTSVQEKLLRAQQAASMISLNLAASASNHITSAKALAEQSARALNDRLGYNPEEEEEEEKAEEPTQIYEIEVDINLLPQPVRYKITNKETLDQIREDFGANLMVKGVYDAKSDKGLVMTIDANNLRSLDATKMELMRIIKEELSRSGSSSYRGRYQVV